MTQLPSLIACDLDGTLVRHDGTVSPRTVAAFVALEDKGVPFVFVTGRPPRLMGQIADAFGGHGLAVCSNGAFDYDLRARAVVAEYGIDPSTLEKVVRGLREAIPGIGLAVEYADWLAADPDYEPGDWDRDLVVQRLAEADLWRRPAPKLVGRHPTLSADELLALAQPAVGDLVTVFHSNGVRLVEAVAPGISKADGLARHASRLGVAAEDVIAFGDMPNDLSMFGWAGRAYAVANAHPSLIAVADDVIGSVQEDGVARFLESLLRT
ncbi:Cof-type HAD-IIB family hydrolase [Catenulispora pinisilvae]|uniref:Cof-type HAD-IIB family hydrolase n=1 Tax=Catenulispora pinisilvae TaxID=2705253 RepID=UPI0018910D5D|nr:Cof-type HAD-IIB family hydrolase [Catenulispora pinisilvae]